MEFLKDFVGDLTLPFTFICAIIAASVGYGKLNQRVEQTADTVNRLETDLKELSDAVARIEGKLMKD